MTLNCFGIVILIGESEILFKDFFSFYFVLQDFEPFAETRRPTIADREDDYRAKRRQMVISPERHNPFEVGV